jgi:general stress protein 26
MKGKSNIETKEQLLDFIKKQKVAFIASVDNDGFPNMKAMLMPRKIDGNCFYFTTNTSSMRVSQYRENEKASIYFFNKGRFRFEGVMLIGTMEVLEDAETKQDIWRIGDKIFYKNGVTDPDYCVLRFTAIKGRHYCDLKTESFDF